MSDIRHTDSACKRRGGTQTYAHSVISSRQLNWRLNGEGFALHFERRLAALLHVVRDYAYAGMWRVRFADGSLSDMANLTRAKDAGRAQGLAALNRQLDYQETARRASPIRQNEVGATYTRPALRRDARGLASLPLGVVLDRIKGVEP